MNNTRKRKRRLPEQNGVNFAALFGVLMGMLSLLLTPTFISSLTKVSNASDYKKGTFIVTDYCFKGGVSNGRDRGKSSPTALLTGSIGENNEEVYQSSKDIWSLEKLKEEYPIGTKIPVLINEKFPKEDAKTGISFKRICHYSDTFYDDKLRIVIICGFLAYVMPLLALIFYLYSRKKKKAKQQARQDAKESRRRKN